MTGVTHEIIRAADSFEAIEPAWRELWRRARTGTPFQSPAWLIPWWRHFHPGELTTAAAWKDGRLIGLAPFYLEDGAHGRRLLPVGISVSDYHDVLLDPEHETEAAGALVSAFDGEACWDSLECEELPPGAAALALPRPRDCAEVVLQQSPCPVLGLGAGSFANAVPYGQRRHLNLARNRARRRGGCAIESVRGESLPKAFEQLVRLHARRWESRGEGGVLADPRVCAFHREALPRLDAAGMLRFYTLGIEGAVTAALYGFRHADIGYAYLTGFDPAYSFESPGAILLAHAIEQTIAEGAREFHFLRGRESYKYGWGAVDRWNWRRSFRRSAAVRSVA
jgi:CelD/BcsL family acetyltransferase involved in cellulose biosynthesis